MKVDINYIYVNYIKYRLNGVYIEYDGNEGVLHSDDDVINDFIRGEHKIDVVEGDKLIPLDYHLKDGKIVISNPASDFK